MEAPTISEETNLTLEQAKREYVEVLGYQKNCPRFGWLLHIENQIQTRLTFLRKTITDFVIGESK